MKYNEAMKAIFNSDECLVVGNIYTIEHIVEMYNITKAQAKNLIQKVKNEGGIGLDFAREDLEELMLDNGFDRNL